MEMGIARSSKEIGSRPADKSERTFIRFRCIFFLEAMQSDYGILFFSVWMRAPTPQQ
jgi:hypothetical protein